MSVQRQLTAPGFTTVELGAALSSRNTSYGEFLGANLQEGMFNAPVLGGAPPELMLSGEDWQAELDNRLQFIRETYGREPTADEIAFAQGQISRGRQNQEAMFTPIDQAGWRASAWFREDIPWEDGMTEERAAWLAQRYDDTRYNQWVIANHEGVGFGVSTTTGFLAQMVGGAADPTNFVPFVGPGMRLAMQARLGVVGGRAAAGSVDAMIGAALTEPVVAYARQRIGDEWTFADALLDVAISGIVGASFGSASGVFARRSEMRHQADLEAARTTLTNLRVGDEALTKTAIAIDQIANGRAVNVPEVSAASRADLLQGMHIAERARFIEAQRETAINDATTVLRGILDEESGAPVRGAGVVNLDPLEVAAVRGATLRERVAAREALDGQREGRIEERRQEPGRAAQDTVQVLRDLDQPEAVEQARAGAEAISGELRRLGRGGRSGRLGRPLSRLERMALSDSNPRLRAAARAELDRRVGRPLARHEPLPGKPSYDSTRPVPQSNPEPTPRTGDASADIDARAEIDRLVRTYGEHGMDESGNFAELTEFQKLEDLTAAERAAFEAAEEEMAKAAKAQQGYDAAIGCLI